MKTSSREEEMFYTSYDDEESEIQAKANIFLMAIDDEVITHNHHPQGM